jgi:hypothetical protein
MQVVVPSTPANYFHVLRRQIRRDFRKPLICISPKSLLRLPACASDVEAFTETGFKTLIGETDSDLVPDEEVRRIIFCCGRVYYDLAKARSDKNIKDVALIRIEQICPFPYDQVRNALHLPPRYIILLCVGPLLLCGEERAHGRTGMCPSQTMEGRSVSPLLVQKVCQEIETAGIESRFCKLPSAR